MFYFESGKMRVLIDTNVFLNVWFREVNPNTGKELWRFSAEFLKKLGNFQSFASRSVIVEIKKILGEFGVDEQKILEKVEAVKIVVDEIVKITKEDRVEASLLSKNCPYYVMINEKEGGLWVISPLGCWCRSQRLHHYFFGLCFFLRSTILSPRFLVLFRG